MDLITELATVLKSVSEDDLARAEPQFEVDPGDKVLGVVDPSTRRLYFVMKLLAQEAALCESELPFLEGAAAEAYRQRAAAKRTRSQICNDLFWWSCRDQFKQLTESGAWGVRKGWKFVAISPPPPMMVINLGGESSADMPAEPQKTTH